MDLLRTTSLEEYSESYHDFADKRTILGIPNMMDTVSNVFGVFPIIYLYALVKRKYVSVLILLLIIQRIASVRYQLRPSEDSLMLDMLSIVTIYNVLLLMLTRTPHVFWVYGLSLASVFYWRYSLNFVPYIAIGGLVIMYTFMKVHKYKPLRIYLYIALGFIILSRISEHSDDYIYDVTNQQLSGQTLKHVLTSVVLMMIVIIIQKTPH